MASKSPLPKTDGGRTGSERSTGQSSGNRVVAFLTRRWLALVLIIVGVFFILQNRDTTSVTLFFAQVTMPQWMALTVVFVLGLVAGILIARSRRGR